MPAMEDMVEDTALLLRAALVRSFAFSQTHSTPYYTSISTNYEIERVPNKMDVDLTPPILHEWHGFERSLLFIAD